MDQGAIPVQIVGSSYEALYTLVSKALFATHVEGKLKVLRYATFIVPAESIWPNQASSYS